MHGSSRRFLRYHAPNSGRRSKADLTSRTASGAGRSFGRASVSVKCRFRCESRLRQAGKRDCVCIGKPERNEEADGSILLHNLEDYHLSLAFEGQATGTYIDVGAGHPIADNVRSGSMNEAGEALSSSRSLSLWRFTRGCVLVTSLFAGLVGRTAAKSTSMWSTSAWAFDGSGRPCAISKALRCRLSDRSHACDDAGKTMRKT